MSQNWSAWWSWSWININECGQRVVSRWHQCQRGNESRTKDRERKNKKTRSEWTKKLLKMKSRRHPFIQIEVALSHMALARFLGLNGLVCKQQTALDGSFHEESTKWVKFTKPRHCWVLHTWPSSQLFENQSNQNDDGLDAPVPSATVMMASAWDVWRPGPSQSNHSASLKVCRRMDRMDMTCRNDI